MIGRLVAASNCGELWLGLGFETTTYQSASCMCASVQEAREAMDGYDRS
jgi:hypothetical protein